MSINSHDMTINQVFSHIKYYIDFYQREYKWKRIHITNLLDDIFYRFGFEYRKTIDPAPENIDKYEWYYLSSFVTNAYNGQTYIVDGQQRLTTLTLIMINLLCSRNWNNWKRSWRIFWKALPPKTRGRKALVGMAKSNRCAD